MLFNPETIPSKNQKLAPVSDEMAYKCNEAPKRDNEITKNGLKEPDRKLIKIHMKIGSTNNKSMPKPTMPPSLKY